MEPEIYIITLCVSNLEKSLAFYRDGLGIIGEFTQGENHVTINLTEDMSMVLFTREEYEKFAGKSVACICHAAESKKEVDEILAKAKAAGGTLPTEPKEYEWGYSGCFKDIDGQLWEVVYMAD